MSLRIPPPLQTVFWGAVIYGTHKVSSDLSLSFEGQRLLGFTLMGMGVMMDLISVGLFSKARTTVNPIKPEKATELVTTGFYRFSRNPMYLGMLLILTGFVVILGNPLSLLGLVGFVVGMNRLQIKPEETALDALFGETYQSYKNKVRRWI